VPILIGTNTDEGTYWLPYYDTNFVFDPSLGKHHPNNQALINWTQYLHSVDSMFAGRAEPLARKAIGMQYLQNAYTNSGFPPEVGS
jgi:hypothetical protein